ncbi:AMP-binding protein [Rhodococcus sp. M8-50]|uniref:AMP-binding protein n=2 Tax=Rhodococcus TaxID=1827 RepID=UPI00092B0FB8|nr:AMP-binding protein [Rhodococcus sp. M8]OLL19499.1 AMP-dependent synthetase [Rhodococcus sp. M8]QPG43332.1 AMP-binding protein [Rhodococcus sp. M8]
MTTETRMPAHAPAYPILDGPAPDLAVRASTGSRTVPWLLDRWRTDRPETTFLIWEPHTGAEAQRWSYAEFAAAVDRLAAGLQARGIAPGDRVVLLMDNCPDFLVGWAAIVSTGAVAVCLNTRSSADELAYYDRHCAPRAALIGTRSAEAARAAMPGLEWIATTGGTETLEAAAPGGTVPERASGSLGALGRAAGALAPVSIDPLAPASIQYTSGTTARPKAVVWTHANCLWAARVNAAHAGLRGTDVGLITLPLFHTNALGYSFLGLLWVGATVVLTPKFSASRFWDVSLRHRCTWASVVSFMLRALDGAPVPAGHTYRHWSGSATQHSVADGIRMTGWFGMTETVSHPVVSELAHPDPDGTMGRPAPEYAVAVVGDDGRPVEPGTVGDLWVRGTPGVSLFAGYLHNDDATREAFTADGWFRTGDRVRQDRSGQLWFVERSKDMLKVGGENVAAAEIERVLAAVPGVREAAVVAKPDPMLGDVPVAFVIPDGAAPDGLPADIERACAELLSDFKRPREVHLVPEFPRATLNKVAKAKLRHWLLEPSTEARKTWTWV